MNWNTVMVYAIISDSIAQGDHPSLEEIAERLDLHVNTVRNCVTTLRDAGYIQAKGRNGQRYRYTILARPPMLDRIRGWFYRFTGNETMRRIAQAQVAARIYYKAGEAERKKSDDPIFCAHRSLLWAEHPEIRRIDAVWPLETAWEIEQRLDALLDWGKDDETATLATVSTETRDDVR